MRSLIYHVIGGSGRYSLQIDQFKDHVHLLSAKPEVNITFDDGHGSQMLAANLIEEAGLRGMFFITTAFLNQSGYLSDDQLAELSRRGHVIGTHGLSHSFLSDLKPVELKRELTESRQRLEMLLGKPVDIMSCPGGRFSTKVLNAAVMAGYQRVFTSEPGSWMKEKPVSRCGRDAVLSTWTTEVLERWLAGRCDSWRALRYRTLDSVKKLVGNRLYHKMIYREPYVD